MYGGDVQNVPERASDSPQSNGTKGLIAALSSHWEITAYTLLITVALLMRLWDLGSRAFGYDESLHGYYSFRLSEGLGFQHSPLMHGPFQFHGLAAMFFLFGDSDYTARLLPALFGTVLVSLPYFLRQRLGRFGSLAVAVMLAFSPMMLFYGRYARNDIFMAVWTLALVTLLWRYLDEGRPRYLYLGALVLALAFATKETVFIVVAILGGYLVIVAATDWIPWLLRRPRPNLEEDLASWGGASPSEPGLATFGGASQTSQEYRYWPGYGYAYGRPKAPHRLSQFSRAGAFLVLLATLAVPQTSAMVSVIQDRLQGAGIILADRGSVIGAPSGDVLFSIQNVDVTKGMIVAGVVVAFALGLSVVVGTTWSRSVWLRSAAIFYSVWLALYTTFFTNMVGVGSGMWQSLGYWLVQQEERRGGQPWYYYFVVAPIYETLPFLFSIAAVVYYILRGDRFTRFLAYWVVLTFVLYSWAGEKMPWLVVNLALPMIVLSGKLIGDIVVAVPWPRVWRTGGLYLVLMVPLLLYFLLRLFFFHIERGNLLNFLEFWTLLAIAILLVGLGVHIFLRSGVKNGFRIAILSLALVLFAFSVRSGWQVSYHTGDVPTEMIVYAQDSGDVPEIMGRVRDLANETGKGNELRLTVDRDIYWGLLWYIRNFKNVDYADMSNVTQAPEGAVLLISDGNEGQVSPYVDKYGPQQEFLYLWWPAEGYKPCRTPAVEPCLSTGEVFGNLFSREKWRQGLDYYVFRKTDVEFLFHKAIAYFPKEGP